MAYVNWDRRVRNGWTPDDYTADQSADPIFAVVAGNLVGPFFARTRVVFNGSGTAAIIIVGDDGDTDRFCADGNMDEATTGVYMFLGGSGSNYTALGRHLYTAANNIDVGFTANTAGTRTTGTVDFFCHMSREYPY